MSSKYYPRISIVVLNYKLWRMTIRCVQSVLACTKYPNYEVVILDNASRNSSLERLSEAFVAESRVQVLPSSVNLGFSGGTMLALEHCTGEYVALLSNDTVVTEGWLTSLYDAINSKPYPMAVQSKLLLDSQRNRIDSLGHRIDPTGFLRAEGYLDSAETSGLKLKRVCILQLVSCLIPRSTIDRIGLFDKDYFIIHEDTDFSFRITLFGGLIVMTPSSIVYHVRSATLSQMPMHEIVFLNRRNILLTIIKNYGARSLVVYGTLHVFVSILLSLWYLFGRREVRWFQSSLRGLFWNLFNLRSTLIKRRIVQSRIRKVDDSKLFEIMDPFSLTQLIRRRNASPVVYEHIGHESTVESGIKPSGCCSARTESSASRTSRL